MIYTLKNDAITVKIASLGAELVSVEGNGFQYIWTGDAWGDHAPLLFPTCGKLLDNRYSYRGKEYKMGGHGFAKISEFELVGASDCSLTLRLASSEATLAIYPFAFELIAEYRIDGCSLYLDLTVKNEGEDVMPYMIGWHPGFVLGGEEPIKSFSLSFSGEEWATMHPLVIKNGNPTPFLSGKEIDFPLENGCYRLNEEQIYSNDTLILTGLGGVATISSDGFERKATVTWSENLPYFCIWKAPESDARFICLEPWSDVPSDGITPECFDTRRMSRLAPRELYKYSYSVKFY